MAVITGGGLASGLGTMSGSLQGIVSGSGLVSSAGKMLGFPNVQCVPLPIDTVLTKPKTFRYLQLLQRGDLAVYLSDASGPVTPVMVTYTMFRILPDGSLRIVGGQDRIPAQGSVGEYYVTGHVGETDQPGRWLIRWDFQMCLGGPWRTREMCFRIQDALLARDPLDTSPRIRKFGWD